MTPGGDDVGHAYEPFAQAGQIDPTHWNDDPITSNTQDSLGRTHYADAAAELIAGSHSWDSSVVFGLTGPWGSGKSSLISMIVESLKQGHEDWAIAQFTPWATSDVTGLLTEFYAALQTALPLDRAKRFRETLGKLAQIAAPSAKLIPVAGEVVERIVAVSGEKLSESKPWREAFKEASDTLQQLSIPVLVVVDDVDRLQTDELLALLKVVRLLGRFPGVQYLLAYDEATLFRCLETASLVGEGSGAAQHFMEKIVQYPLTVPPLLTHQVITLLDSGIARVLEETKRRHAELPRLSWTFDVLQSQLSTPRAIERFLAQLRHILPMVDQSEINDVDVILLTAVRAAFPTVYEKLPRWRDTLLTGLKQDGGRPSDHVADWSPLLESVNPRDREDARKLVQTLFPKLQGDGPVVLFSEPRRVSDEDYFDRYFAMGVPTHDVSDAEVAEAVYAASQGDNEPLRALLLNTERSRAYLALRKAARDEEALTTTDEHLQLLCAVAGVADELDDSRASLLSPMDAGIQWMSEILTRLDEGTSTDEILTALAHAGTVSQLRVWRSGEPRLASLPDSPHWASDVTSVLVDVAVDHFVSNLVAGDEAAPDDPALFYAEFAITLGSKTDLHSRVAKAITDGTATVADLAARMVSTKTLMGVSDAAPELNDFDNELWHQLAPEREDDWYSLPVAATIDTKDTTWENRKRFAQGRAKRPTQGHAAADES